ncbi:MAG: primosomal protein N', partial [Pseudoleptotrichia goodfellowii]|nr:primosomal protein N' [Pseudoleptotrichia goodfellowii]
MYYYQMYVENNKNIYTYKSQDKYEIGEWCIVNFANRNKMALVLSEINETELTIDTAKIKFISDKAPVLSVPSVIMELVK